MAFPEASRRTLTAFILSLSAHLSRKRPADAFLDFLTNSSSIVIVFLNELSSALGASPTVPVSDAIETYLELKPESNLANILNTKHQQRKLDLVAEDILQSFLEPKTYNCEAARVFLREVLAKVILEMTIQSCSKPEWINGWIVYLLEEGETELVDAIDAGIEGSVGNILSNVEGSAVADEDEAVERDPYHQRVVSKAQEAMDEAMREAQRLTQLMADEDARRLGEHASENIPNKPTQPKAANSDPYANSDKSGPSPSAPGSHPGFTVNGSDDVSEDNTQGIVTPTSSQSDINGDGVPGASSNVSMESASRLAEDSGSAPQTASKSPFTSFDQILSSQPPTALLSESDKVPLKGPLTLFDASISILDDPLPGDRGTLRNKPATEYLIQIEPASSHYGGWMIARRYADFEMLHEVLRRISAISGVGFNEAHAALPGWRNHSKASLRGELERYLNDAVRFKQLAESEGMKRFLEKEQSLGRSAAASNKAGFPGIGWPTPSAFENMGKGMMDVLTKAPKEVAGGGKALFGGVTGVLGGIGSKKASTQAGGSVRTSATAPPPRADTSVTRSLQRRASQDSVRNSPIVDTQPARVPQMERLPSYSPSIEAEMRPRPSSSSRSSIHTRSSRENSRPGSGRQSMDFSLAHGGDQIVSLPPLPTDIPDDYGSNRATSPVRKAGRSNEPEQPAHTSTTAPPPSTNTTVPEKPSPQQHRPTPPLTEQETQVSIELLFATITELYTLSSAWSLRRTLLAAAKAFLLRPGNPQLDSIRQLIQSAVLDASTTDAGAAALVRRLRAATLPTEAELRAWPAPAAAPERERLRARARALLVERGVPLALASVMGSAASGEALGKVFDCLQVERLARGLVFGLLLQGLRAVTQ